jgi:molecular chaperone HscA
MTLATRSALAADGELLEAAEREAIEQMLEQLQARAQGGDTAAIEAALKAVAEGTEAFAAERMNRGIRQALAGRRVEDV